MLTRALIVCLLGVMLIEPAAAGAGPSDVAQIVNRPRVLEALGLRDVSDAMARWARTHTYVLNGTILRSHTTLAASDHAPGNVSPCNRKLALGPDPRCVGACDAAKESCDRQCGSTRATCLSQCPGLGFACDYYCQAAYLVCKANCGRARDSCLSNCPTRGGEKES